jgi:hypothetical protein
MGVFVTASEANRQRVLALIVEDEQMLSQLWYDLPGCSPDVTPAEAPSSKPAPLSISGKSDSFQLPLF